MFSFLSNFKLSFQVVFIVIALLGIIYGQYWHNRYIVASQKLVVVNHQLDTQTAAIDRLMAESARYAAQLKSKEKEVRKQDDKSKQAIRRIMNIKISTECNQAIKDGIKNI
jgi:D-mannonate dehydratase